jgi:hypothetical protein
MTTASGDATVHPAAVRGSTDVPAPLVSIWHWFSGDQAIAAATLSRLCADLEADPPGPSDEEESRGLMWSEAAQRQHRSFAIASIMSSVGFIETSMNELFASAHHDNLQVGGDLQSGQRHVLVQTAGMVENNRLLDRFQLALYLLGRPPFDRGTQPFQDAQLLVHLRNELVHYKPRWRAGGDESAQTVNESWLTKGLETKHLSPNPFTGAGNPFFPDKCLGHGCTAWAFRTALAFCDVFFTKIGVRPIHDNLRSLLVP